MEQERLWTLLGKKLAGLSTDDELQELELLVLAYGEESGSIEIIERMWISRKQMQADNGSGSGMDKGAISNRIGNALGFSVELLPSLTTPVPFSTTVSVPSVSTAPAATDKKKGARYRWLTTSMLACILFVVCFAIWEKTRTIGKNETRNVLFTRKKSHSNLQFPDGTLVMLNENSRITYNADFGKDYREITLEGEAYFDVAKNAKIPLIIHAKNVDIRVLGTTLNVKAYPQDSNVETSLIKGSVEVVSNRYPKQKVLLKPNEKIAVATVFKDEETIPDENSVSLPEQNESNAGSGSPMHGATPTALTIERQPATNGTDTLSYRLQHLTAERSTKLIPEIAWMYRKMVFNQESFESVAEKMERWYDVKFYFEDDDLRKEIFTGSFGKESLEEALKALYFSYPFSYIIKKKEVFIKKK